MKEAPEDCIVRLYAVLHRIAKGYMTPAQLHKVCQQEYGLSYTEALENAYENIQLDAAGAIKSMRKPKTKTVTR